MEIINGYEQIPINTNGGMPTYYHTLIIVITSQNYSLLRMTSWKSLYNFDKASRF